MGYLLIIIGIVLVIAGAVVISKEKKIEEKVIERVEVRYEPAASSEPVANNSEHATQQTSTVTTQTQQKKTDKKDESHKKGREFEEYVVKHFNKDYFTIKEWRGDKGVDGRFAEENMKPDIVMTLHLEKGNYDVAVECKWRKGFRDGKVEVSYPEQMDRYREYARKAGHPVFMVIGVGGEPGEPKAVYCLPLGKLKGASITEKELEPYYHKPEHLFYYDVKTKVLR